jgi:hypothetical protein
MKAYRNLSIEDSHYIKHKNEKENLENKCVRRFRLILNTEVSGKNKMQAMGALTIPELRYNF